MITRIDRRTCLQAYPLFPIRHYDPKTDEESYFFPETTASYVLTLPSKTFKGHVRSLGLKLTNLIRSMRLGELVFLGDMAIAWRGQDNDYKPVREALQFLASHGVGKRFNGGLQVSQGMLPEFTRHLSWLIRCNAALPYIHFMDASHNVLGSICQYGNLHIYTLNEHTDSLLRRLVAISDFEYLEGNRCRNWPLMKRTDGSF